MTYYLVNDMGTQWFHYAVFLDSTKKLVDALDMRDFVRVPSTLLSNIYGREFVTEPLYLHDSRLVNSGGTFGGWTISELEFNCIKRMVELMPGVQEFNKIKDSI
jgi:hypothetical protein